MKYEYVYEFVLPLKLEKYAILGYDFKILLANQFKGFFTFDLIDFSNLIPGFHRCIVLFSFVMPLRSWCIVPAMMNFFSKEHKAKVTFLKYRSIDILLPFLECCYTVRTCSKKILFIFLSFSRGILKQIRELLQDFQRKLRSSMCMFLLSQWGCGTITVFFWFIRVILHELNPSASGAKGFKNGRERRGLSHLCISFISSNSTLMQACLLFFSDHL